MARPRRGASGDGEVEMGDVDGVRAAPLRASGSRRLAAMGRYGGEHPVAAEERAAASDGDEGGDDDGDEKREEDGVRSRWGRGSAEPAAGEKKKKTKPKGRGRAPPLRKQGSVSSGRSARSKSALNLLEEVRAPRGRRWCNWHRGYQWLCMPYEDKWLPYPSKKTLHKTLNRLDFNSFNPFDVFDEYYNAFTTPPGMLFTLGCVTLLVLYSMFAAQVFLKDDRVQQDSFVEVGDAEAFFTSALTGVSFLAAGGSAAGSLAGLGLLSFEVATCALDDDGAESCTALTGDAGLAECAVQGLPAMCTAAGFSMTGYRTSALFSYTRVRATLADGADVTALEGGSFAVLSDGDLSDQLAGDDHEEVGDPSFPVRELFPYRAAATAVAGVRYRRHVNEFPSKILRDAAFARYTQFLASDARARSLSGGVLFEARFEMDATLHERKFVGETVLDVVSNVGGILMLIKLVVLVFSVYVVQEAFKQTRKLRVNPTVAKALLKKKAEQLDRFKRDLAEQHVENAVRLSRDELFDYLNAKRDSELSTFRHSLFSSLNTRVKNNAGNVRDVWDIASAPVKETVDEAHKAKRNDELQNLVRVDEADREEDPELPKVLNILAMDEIQRQTAILQEFLRHVRT